MRNHSTKFVMNITRVLYSGTTTATMDSVSNVTVKGTINTTMDCIVNVGLNGTANESNTFPDMYGDFSSVGFLTMIMYTNLFLFLVGLFGNCLTIIVSIKSKSTLNTTMIYFTALAVSDIVILVNNSLILPSLQLLDYGIEAAFCKIITWIGYSCGGVSSWILVAVTIERLICVTIPHKVKIYCYPNLAKATVGSVFVVIYGVNCHFLFGIHSQNGECLTLPGTYSFFINEIFPLLDFYVVVAIPFVTICIGNSVIIYKLYQGRRRRLSMSHSHQDSKRNDSSMTVMLAVVNVWFITCTAPWSLYTVSYESNNTYEDPWKDPTFAFWNKVLNTFTNLNSVGNFYLYLLSGESFRKQVNTFFSGFSCRRNLQNAFEP